MKETKPKFRLLRCKKLAGFYYWETMNTEAANLVNTNDDAWHWYFPNRPLSDYVVQP